jgi:hypothetical protein
MKTYFIAALTAIAFCAVAPAMAQTQNTAEYAAAWGQTPPLKRLTIVQSFCKKKDWPINSNMQLAVNYLGKLSWEEVRSEILSTCPDQLDERKLVEKGVVKVEPASSIYYQDRNRRIGISAPPYGYRPYGYGYGPNYGPGYRRDGYDTFDNVARGSHHVRTSSGKDYVLRSIGGNTQNCPPPAKLHRTEMCKAIPGGGIRCKFACY